LVATASTVAINRAALRALEKLERLEGDLGLVIGSADLGRQRHQADRTENSPQDEGRALGLPFEELLKVAKPLLDPFGRGRSPNRRASLGGEDCR
jgi:hypothetical protein